jgi:hypothetical protein
MHSVLAPATEREIVMTAVFALIGGGALVLFALFMRAVGRAIDRDFRNESRLWRRHPH